MLDPVRYVLAQIEVLDPDADEDGNDPLTNRPAKSKWVQTSIDMWSVREVCEGFEKNTVTLEYYDGDEKTVKGTFKEWYDKHVQAKAHELHLVRMPYLN